MSESSTLIVEIWGAAEDQGVRRTDSKNLFLGAQRNPQGGWYIMPHSTLMDAEEHARKAKVKGKVRYIVSADDRHSLIALDDGGNFTHLP